MKLQCEAVHRPYELLSCASSRANTKGIDGRSLGRAHGHLKLCKALTAVSCSLFLVSCCAGGIEDVSRSFRPQAENISSSA